MDLDLIQIFQKLLGSSQKPTELRPKLLRVFENVLEQALIDERISFTSLFAKISFLGEKYNLSGFERYELHYLRKLIEENDDESKEQIIHLLSYLIPHLLQTCLGIQIPSEIQKIIPSSSGVKFEKRPISKYLAEVKFYCLETVSYTHLTLPTICSV